MPTLTRQWDPLFAKYAGRLPVAYLRALGYRESSLNPRGGWPSDPAIGLLQIVEIVRKSYNERFGTSFTREQLLDPDLNVRMATELINRIVAGYQKHPDRNMKEDWSNNEFVKLLTAGWNSGYSEGGGVGKVAKYLEARGIPVTHDNVFAHAAAAGATKHLQEPGRLKWQRSVADLYFAQPDAGQPNLAIAGMGGGGLLFTMIAIGGGALAAYLWRRRKSSAAH